MNVNVNMFPGAPSADLMGMAEAARGNASYEVEVALIKERETTSQ